MRVVGLISGTSVDGIDAALVDISGTTQDLSIDLIAAATYPYPDALRSHILSVCGGALLTLADLAELDDAIAQEFAQAAIALQSGHAAADLIGSHGQTVYHRPLSTDHPSSLAYSMQLGRGALITHLTRQPTVSNFRVADIAAGGQGAPLVPPVDACLLRHPSHPRCVQNIGGIGNVTYLPPLSDGTPILGWDTGPGNTLLDLATQQLSQQAQTYDQDGQWAAQGQPCPALVQQWMQQDFFQQPPPKSTGREWFGRHYLDQCFQDATDYDLSPADMLATLAELTAVSIAHSYQTFLPQMPKEVLLCGGGSRNRYLHQRIQAHLPWASVQTTDEAGVNADFKEAIAFAVLAYWRHQGIPGNLPEVTGAQQAMLLGEINLVVSVG